MFTPRAAHGAHRVIHARGTETATACESSRELVAEGEPQVGAHTQKYKISKTTPTAAVWGSVVSSRAGGEKCRDGTKLHVS